MLLEGLTQISLISQIKLCRRPRKRGQITQMANALVSKSAPPNLRNLSLRSKVCEMGKSHRDGKSA